jgi:hypothetical protein
MKGIHGVTEMDMIFCTPRGELKALSFIYLTQVSVRPSHENPK